MKKITLCLVAALLLIGCGSNKKTPKQTVAKKQFTLPQVPAMLQSPQERATYVVAHYWDNFDFSDTTLIKNADITEQAFVDYIDLFAHVELSKVGKSIAKMLNSVVAGDSIAFGHFTKLYERYLYDPNSPFRQEDYYIEVLRAIIANEQVDEVLKIRPRDQLEMALKNRPNTIATDFALTLRNGRSIKLSAVKATYTVLFFNNPDCNDCERVKKLLTEWSDTRVKIVAVYPDEDIALWRKTDYPPTWLNGYANTTSINKLYDLRAMPTLYLLDSEKRIVLKDKTIEQVLEYCRQNSL